MALRWLHRPTGPARPGRIRRAAVAVTAVVAVAVVAAVALRARRADVPTAVPTAAPTQVPPTTAPAEATATPAPTQVPSTPAPVEARADAQTRPDRSLWRYQREVRVDGKPVADYARSAPIAFDAGEAYRTLDGVITFRGGNLRQNAAYGTAALEQPRFRVLWRNHIGFIDSGYAKWTGVGWTGQPVLVRWPAALKRIMNLDPAWRDRDDLVEVIYGTLDGNIYFLDALTGKPTRKPIELGFPIKGSVSVDPRGYPLLYVGQGISRANGHTGSIGWRVYSLIDQRELFFLDGRDKLSYRDHGAFDGACLVHGDTDTVLLGGENGLFYSIRLNAAFDPDAPGIALDPEVTTYRYRSAASRELGIENSIAAYGGYAWFADNSGLLTCLDLNAMAPAWLGYVGDDTDATLALEPEADGRVALYTVNEVDKQGASGRCTVRRIDALTGVTEWSFSVDCTSDGDNGGGGLASPAVGENAYADLVFFNLCRTSEGGTLYAFDKRTGEVRWHRSTGRPSWSSPVLVYREDGTGVLVNGVRDRLRMYDPADGRTLGEIEIKGRLEGSPAVFDDVLVVGTRSQYIYGIRLG